MWPGRTWSGNGAGTSPRLLTDRNSPLLDSQAGQVCLKRGSDIWGVGDPESSITQKRKCIHSCFLKVKVARSCRLFATPRTIQSLESCRPEYWSGLPCPPPGALPDPEIEHLCLESLVSPTLAGRFFTTEHSGKPHVSIRRFYGGRSRQTGRN